MRQINPYLKAGYDAERRAKGLLYKEKFKETKMRKAQCYLEGVHHFHLIIGDKETNRYRDMTGREAKTINDAMKATFFQACMEDENTQERLHHWRCEKRFIGVPDEADTTPEGDKP